MLPQGGGKVALLVGACLVAGCLEDEGQLPSREEPGYEIVAGEGVRADVLLWVDGLLLCGGTIDHAGEPRGLWCPTDNEADGQTHAIRLRATYATTGATREAEWEIQDGFARFIITQEGPTRA